ncbi:hypothetical protein EJ05DRAFT_534767 [Pseudovirgaria hyperparasitica]|uniref:HTH TFE/IIEalpha-type domain-containing protein n=1 Tax=Pseudovirgaria hyperparasitica TaxID=470096 RepID=A0A6A6WMI4_9PEZI|nr:uncharacterized protein EJ05DRAFT_534767 [Pseudovirgaria hyperparasitica]KAF2763415.1 hypothetical protein EJ05DRAFT_534767 [Pseudovirgaria hyperparasitica]
MDLAKILVRSVVRAFYDIDAIVVIDALVNHSALSISDLATVLMDGNNQKNAQKICGKLREGGLISVYVRQEIKEGAMKPTNKEYFYIDYRRAIDATKYRVHMLDERIKAESKPTQEKKELQCPTCRAEYTTMEVLDSRDSFNMGSGFTCKRCGSVLKMINTDGDAIHDADDTPAKFNKQFGRLLNLLQQIDNTSIPPSSGEEALANQLPVPRATNNPGAKPATVVVQPLKPTAVKGITSGPEKLDINITDDASVTAAEQAAAAAQAAKIAQQNILPEWHTHSTITGERAKAGVQQTATPETPNSALGLRAGEGDVEEDKKGPSGDATLDEYFASLEAEQERKQLEGSGSEDDEDDDDEFEDVVPVPPVVSADIAREAKRVKTEANGTDGTSTPTVPAQDDEGSGSDEDEFEDAI